MSCSSGVISHRLLIQKPVVADVFYTIANNQFNGNTAIVAIVCFFGIAGGCYLCLD